jgi:hypothetical protein
MAIQYRSVRAIGDRKERFLIHGIDTSSRGYETIFEMTSNQRIALPEHKVYLGKSRLALAGARHALKSRPIRCNLGYVGPHIVRAK